MRWEKDNFQLCSLLALFLRILTILLHPFKILCGAGGKWSLLSCIKTNVCILPSKQWWHWLTGLLQCLELHRSRTLTRTCSGAKWKLFHNGMENSSNYCILTFCVGTPSMGSFQEGKKKLSSSRWCPASNKRKCWWIGTLVFPDLVSCWPGEVMQPFSFCLPCILCKAQGWRVKSGNFTRKGKLRYLYLSSKASNKAMYCVITILRFSSERKGGFSGVLLWMSVSGLGWTGSICTRQEV